MKIVIPVTIIKIFRDKAMKSDIEECGLLVGNVYDSDYYVKAIFLAQNLEKSSISFTMDPYTILSAYEYADRYDMEVLATIHSHPTLPRPSQIDLKNMSIWTIPWIIMDSRTGEIDAWIYEDTLKKLEYILVD